MRTTGLCALALLLILTGSIPAVAQDDDEDDAQDGLLDEAPDDAGPPPTQATLAPYGQWIDDPGYGRVWQPTVAFGWRPYTYGHWAWGPFGWTWVSVEPWGCTFHYGRWALAPTGWVWVPGTVWGPAWVDWYWGDGFVGWAPLGPAVTHVTVVDRFVFVPER